ncbi:hypothetical protein K469DRAFT_291100 [Zopfia rhizophila CBS 207.26]|uniref:Uncharacterized protein n=1 Tax=Zopfia rhizophila CBS 207.26 TaxID=1314779 RepID=A0A6A6DLA1_9PEZI|nr:hypothetical protein K469DRAFT_291100 [Zopfia rhizophila CBS 207.26]
MLALGALCDSAEVCAYLAWPRDARQETPDKLAATTKGLWTGTSTAFGERYCSDLKFSIDNASNLQPL